MFEILLGPSKLKQLSNKIDKNLLQFHRYYHIFIVYLIELHQ